MKLTADARWPVLLYAATLLLGALLLFSVQLMFAKMVLPLLGGSPAVWNTCMVFFQTALLAGYGYAHLTTSTLSSRRQAAIHALVVLLPLLTLPIRVPADWAPPVETHPVPWLLTVLLLRVGLPFAVVSTSAPLLQRWFASTGHPAARDPYFLYAASNLGSLLALLSYPVLVEPSLTLPAQTWAWMLGYGVFAGLTWCCAFVLRRFPASLTHAADSTTLPPDRSPHDTSGGVTWSRRLWWVMLSFVPSSLLLGVTTYLSTDIASIPLLWVIPLALYLLTFVFVFSAHPLVPHGIMVRALPVVILPLTVAMVSQKTNPMWVPTILHLAMFFVTAMVCHGELAKDRPPIQHLTAFYLCLSLGGVLGGMFNALVAPVIFDTVMEYPLVMVLACVLWPGMAAQGQHMRTTWMDYAMPAAFGVLYAGLIVCAQEMGLGYSWLGLSMLYGLPALICFALFRYRPVRFGLGVGVFLLVGLFMTSGWGAALHLQRSFFGIYRVAVDVTSAGAYHKLVHGTTLHGMQSLDPARRREPLTYYAPTGPLGQIFDTFSGTVPRLRHVGVIGLGTGSTACYATPGQQWTFYEIDPVMKQIATTPRLFTFVRDCLERVEIVMGDARLSLARAPRQAYDFLVVDAFSSDAIPIHLLTREAMHLYLEKLADGGMLAFHISNRYLDLEPVLANLAASEGLAGIARSDQALSDEELARRKTASVWVVLTRQQSDLGQLGTHAQWHALIPRQGMRVWTDDFSNILSVFKPK